MALIVRNHYLKQLIDLTGTPDIKVVTGIRRCGKSVLLRQYMDWLTQNESGVNIIFVNLQELEFDELLDYHKLHPHLERVFQCKNS